MKKTIAAFAVATLMGMGASNSFAADISTITSLNLASTGFGQASAIAGNFANLNQSVFQIVSAEEYTTNGWFGGSGASMFGVTDIRSNAVMTSGASANVSSLFGGTAQASIVNAQFGSLLQ